MDSPIEDIKLLRNIVQYSSEGILMVDKNGIILNVNQSAEQLFGYDHGELFYKELACIFPQNFLKSHCVE